jgi:hypothetical protein
MTDIADVPVVEAVETPAIAEIVSPVEEPVAPTEESKQAERTFTQEEHERAIQAAKAKLERKYEREYRQRLESENASLRQRDAPKAAEPPGKPVRENYSDDVAFVEDLAGWKADQQFAKRMEVQQQDFQKQSHARSIEEAKQNYEKRAEAIRVTNPDFDELVRDPDLNINESMAVAIALSENGPKLALYLAKNPGEADRIARLNPALAQMELGRLDAKISAPTAKTISTAPKPLTAVQSTKAIVADLTNLSQEEYEKARRKQGARW